MMVEPIESTYFDVCTVKRLSNVVQPNGSLKQEYQAVHTNIPCALSIGTRPALNSITEYKHRQEDVSNLIQTQDRLFLNPSFTVKQGDEVTIYHNGRTIIATAGLPFIYSSHQVLHVENVRYA